MNEITTGNLPPLAQTPARLILSILSILFKKISL